MTAAEYQQHKTSTTNLSASNINLIVTKEKSIYTFASTKYRQKYLELDWRDELKNNDILITKSGDLRVIREAVYYNDECLSHIVLAIRKCSWTRSPTTSYDRSALKTLKFRKAAVKAFFDYIMNRLIPILIEAKDRALEPIRRAFPRHRS